MTPAAFMAAHLRGIAASPFAGQAVLRMGTASVPLDGCVIEVNDNNPRAEEWGIARARTIDLQIPKSLVTQKPRIKLDAITHNGTTYTLTVVTGDEDHSPVWAITGASPL